MKRITFDVRKADHDKIWAAAGDRGERLRDFAIQAMLKATEPAPPAPAPTFTFSAERRPLEDFLAGAREVIMAGVALTSLHRPELQAALKSLIDARAPMTFLMLHPEVETESPAIYRVLNRRYRYSRYGGLTAELKATEEACQKLLAYGRENKSPVRVRFCLSELPMCGLVIANAFTDDCKFRASFYLYAYHGVEPDPFFEGNSSTPEGREAANKFTRHYERLLGVSIRPAWVSDDLDWETSGPVSRPPS